MISGPSVVQNSQAHQQDIASRISENALAFAPITRGPRTGSIACAVLCRYSALVGRCLCLETRTSDSMARTLHTSTVLCPTALLQETMSEYTETFSGVGWTWRDTSQRTLVATSERSELATFCAFPHICPGWAYASISMVIASGFACNLHRSHAEDGVPDVSCKLLPVSMHSHWRSQHAGARYPGQMIPMRLSTHRTSTVYRANCLRMRYRGTTTYLPLLLMYSVLRNLTSRSSRCHLRSPAPIIL